MVQFATPTTTPDANLTQDFIKRVRHLPQVEKVIIEELGKTIRIWTVIHGQPFDGSIREPVYRAQQETLEANPDALVDFRLLNVEEYADQDVSTLLPVTAKTFWPSPSAS